MITYKTPQEVKTIGQGGKLLAAILLKLKEASRPGITTYEIDLLAEELILQAGGIPAFKNYQEKGMPPFPTTICTSVNEQLVHTPAGNYKLKEGDILSIDIGMKYPEGKGLFTDMAITFPIGQVPLEVNHLIKATKDALDLGINQVMPGNYISDISKAVQTYVEKEGFNVVRQLVGHGVGYQVHEEPRVPNYIDKNQPKVELKEGMVLAIEPMVNVGDPEIKTLDDGWTIVTGDGKLCAHFEHTVAVTKDGVEVLTKS
jgi:methionyl aminopeptidase